MKYSEFKMNTKELCGTKIVGRTTSYLTVSDESYYKFRRVGKKEICKTYTSFQAWEPNKD